MRIILTILTIVGYNFCIAQNSISQTSKADENQQSNIARYRIDYQLKEYSFQNGDSTILRQLDLASYEALRQEFNDVEVQDEVTGLIIILYNRKEILERRSVYRIEY